MASTGYAPWVIDSALGYIYRWTCTICEATGIQGGELATIQAGNAHLRAEHESIAEYNTGLEGWDQPPPDWPPEPTVTRGVDAHPSYWVSRVDEGSSTANGAVEYTWRCDLDWAWGVAETENRIQRLMDKHVHHYHKIR